MCVDEVCRDHPAIAALPHGTQSMDAFLYNLPPYPSKTLEGAATDHNLHLLRRLLSDATSGRNTTCTEHLSCKPITVLQHSLLLGIHISKAALVAEISPVQAPAEVSPRREPTRCRHERGICKAGCAGDVEIIKWLHANRPCDPKFVDSSQAGARAGGDGHIYVLEWLCEFNR